LHFLFGFIRRFYRVPRRIFLKKAIEIQFFWISYEPCIVLLSKVEMRVKMFFCWFLLNNGLEATSFCFRYVPRFPFGNAIDSLTQLQRRHLASGYNWCTSKVDTFYLNRKRCIYFKKQAHERIVLQAADYSIYHDLLVANFIPENIFCLYHYCK